MQEAVRTRWMGQNKIKLTFCFHSGENGIWGRKEEAAHSRKESLCGKEEHFKAMQWKEVYKVEMMLKLGVTFPQFLWSSRRSPCSSTYSTSFFVRSFHLRCIFLYQAILRGICDVIPWCFISWISNGTPPRPFLSFSLANVQTEQRLKNTHTHTSFNMDDIFKNIDFPHLISL